MTSVDARPWSGHWVAHELGLSFEQQDSGSAVQLEKLLGLALRRNPRRAHLLVSLVLGKHVPTDPHLVYGAGRLLGAMVGDLLGWSSVAVGRLDQSDLTAAGLAALGSALSADGWPDVAAAARALLGLCDRHAGAVDITPGSLVVGFAETATGLGHAVSDSLGADYLHSTRRVVSGVRPIGRFEEEHSHATSHLLLPRDPTLLSRDAPLILVDDELSTGRTVINTIEVAQARHPRKRYVVAALVDLRSPADRARMGELAADLDVRIDTVCLAPGQLAVSAQALSRGRALVEQQRAVSVPATQSPGVVRRVPEPSWPADLADGGRHGFSGGGRPRLEQAAGGLAAGLARTLAGRQQTIDGPRRVLVLGTEEFMYVPVRIAGALADELSRFDPPIEVLFSSTTRSPVLAIDDPTYAVRTSLSFPSHDDPADGAGPRFAYNVWRRDPAQRFTDIVVCLDAAADTAGIGEPDGLLGQLARAADFVDVLAMPAIDSRPVAQPLRGPEFGSYPAPDVSWLLTDLSGVALEAPTEEREEAIQSGGAHYAESLPIEYQPSAEYRELFEDALAASADRIAHAVGVVTELTLAERGFNVVFASLARAGTPIGVLMRRWAKLSHSIDITHYSVSIVRGKGIDNAALQYLAAHHNPADVVFVDGWTGKGAITRELAAAVDEFNSKAGLPREAQFCADLAVLADPGGCAQIYGTREDYLIPSACLNSTVSGLVSRTVLNADYIGAGQFHGAKFYSELAGADVSMRFIDAVVAHFPAVADAVAADWPRVRSSDRQPTWIGWRTVEVVSTAYGIGDVNLVKPGVGETTRVLLRRVPWKILVRTSAKPELGHILLLAQQRGVEVEFVDELAYASIGLIHPAYTRGAIGADGRTISA